MALNYTLAFIYAHLGSLTFQTLTLKDNIVLTNQVQSKHLIFECANI